MATKSPLAMLFVDIDDFKQVNNKLGHDGADEVLKHLANNLRRSVGTKGTAYRFGGDEFVILLPNYLLDEAAGIAKRLNSETAHLEYPQNISVTVTIGVSAWPTLIQDVETLFKTANNLVLEGKKQRSEEHCLHNTQHKD
jgi:diguanylate cyclase (GGDEF)-like protein